MTKSSEVTRSRFSIESLPGWVVAVFGTIICGVLAVSSLFSLANLQMENLDDGLPEQVVLASRNFLHVLPVVVILSVALLFLMRQKISWKAAWIFTAASAAVQVGLGFWWKASFKSSPVADQGTFWDVAKVLAGLQEPNEAFITYLKYWPFQAAGGMTGEPFARLFRGDYGSWQVFNALCVGGCIVMLCCICGRITGSARAKAGCAVLLTGFFPLAMYTTFVYGTLAGTMTSLLGIYAVIRECTAPDKKIALRWWIVGMLSLTLAVTYYTGMQIFLVASGLILLATGLFHKGQRAKISAAIAMLVLAMGFHKIWQMIALYRLGMGNEPGCPILPRIAMGVDAFTDVTPGFYNFMNAGFYYASNLNPKIANQTAAEYIVKCMNELWSTGRIWSFFYEKTADQWLEPWFGGLTMNNPSIFDEPKWLATALTGGVLFRPVQAWLSMLLPVIYVWSTVGVVALLRKHKQQVWQLSLVVCLIGGFLFQLMAEAKARYCLPYFLCCFPLAAAGLSFTAQHLPALRKGKPAAK